MSFRYMGHLKVSRPLWVLLFHAHYRLQYPRLQVSRPGHPMRTGEILPEKGSFCLYNESAGMNFSFLVLENLSASFVRKAILCYLFLLKQLLIFAKKTHLSFAWRVTLYFYPESNFINFKVSFATWPRCFLRSIFIVFKQSNLL